MQTPPIKKRRIPYGSIFVAIVSILIIIRVILYYIPDKPATVPLDIQHAPAVSDLVEKPISQTVSVPKKKDAVTGPAIVETFSLTAGTAKLSLSVTGGSLLSILTSAKKRGEIALLGKEYTGLGFFVTEIGSLQQTEGKYLMYSINGKEASVGVSGYIPKNGDTVIWERK